MQRVLFSLVAGIVNAKSCFQCCGRYSIRKEVFFSIFAGIVNAKSYFKRCWDYKVK